MSIAHVQTSSFATTGGAENLSLTLNGVAAGNALILGGLTNAAETAVASDDKGNTWVHDASRELEYPRSLYQFYALDVASGNTQVTLDPGGGTIEIGFAVSEYSGVVTASPDDGSSTGTGTSTTADPGDATVAGVGTLLVATMATPGGGPHTENAGGEGFTLLVEYDVAVGGVTDRFSMVYKIVNAGTHTHTWTLNTSEDWGAQIFGYKSAPTAELTGTALADITEEDIV